MVLAVSALREYFQPVMDNMTGYRNNPDFVAAGQAARLMCPHCRGLIAPEQKRELNNGDLAS